MSWLHHTKRTTARILVPYAWHYFTDDYKDRRHHLVIDTIGSFVILLLLGINVVIGSWIYLFSIEPEVTVELFAPDVVISGEEMTLTGQLTAQTKTINNAEVKLVVPTNFQTDEAKTIQLDKVKRGASEQFELTGRFTGNVKQTYRAVALYSYRYYGQSFGGAANVEFVVDTSSLEVIATTPDLILNNESFTWTVEYHNSSQVERTQVCIELELPDSFKVENSSLPIDNEQIILDVVPPNGSGIISITGSFSNAIGEGNHVIGVTGIDQCDQADGLRQSSLQQAVEVLTPRLQITTSGPATANVGEQITYNVNYTNTGDATLDNVTTTVRLDNGTIEQWTDGPLAPGERRTKTFTRSVSSNTRQKNLAISHSVSAVATIADLDIQTYTPSFSYQTKINSTLNFSHVARYNSTSGEQLGYGPYPLRAWEITALRVFWQVEDFTNDLSNVTISTTLPSQVEWTGYSAVTEGGAMAYDATTRTVTWHTSSIPSFSHAQGASFEVRVLPNSAQVGQAINITNDVRFSARDSFTGVVLTRTLGALRTPPIEAER